MPSYKIIGLMSGTSLDGLDISYCQYDSNHNNEWDFKFLTTAHYPYDKSLIKRILSAPESSAWDLIQLNKELAIIWGKYVNEFLLKGEIDRKEVDCVASHGQTIFHQPQLGITTQIGCPQTLSTSIGINVIADFRTKDVVHGGQGAPLVPIGDHLLFKKEYDALINIGGFVNITLLEGNALSAFDICPGNLPLNKLTQEISGQAYDDRGLISKNGCVIPELLDKLNNITFYEAIGPKSLGTEWLVKNFYPLLNAYSANDMLTTVVEHIAHQISRTIDGKHIKNVLITGGGAYNDFLIERIKYHSTSQIHIPSESLIEFKEALIFGFLGALNLAHQANCLSCVTGADTDVIGGIRYSP